MSVGDRGRGPESDLQAKEATQASNSHMFTSWCWNGLQACRLAARTCLRIEQLMLEGLCTGAGQQPTRDGKSLCLEGFEGMRASKPHLLTCVGRVWQVCRPATTRNAPAHTSGSLASRRSQPQLILQVPEPAQHLGFRV